MTDYVTLKVGRSIGWSTKSAFGIGIGIMLAILIVLIAPQYVESQAPNAASISLGPILTQYGTPAANAPVRVCLLTAVGVPCPTTGVALYSNYNLTGSTLPNPTTLNSQGILNVFVASGSYLIQVTPVATQPQNVYTFYDITSSSGGGGSTPAVGPLGAFQQTDGAGNFTSTGVYSLVGLGDSRMAGCNTVATLAGATTGHLNCGLTPQVSGGLLGNQDFISALARQSNFINRTPYIANFGVGGSTCTDALAAYTSNNVASYAPGGSNAPLATKGYVMILTGINDAFTGHVTPLATYQNCMGSLISLIVSNNQTPILLTSYYASDINSATFDLMESYNKWFRSLSGTYWGTSAPSLLIFDIDNQFPPQSSGSMFDDVTTTANSRYTFDSYSISGGNITVNLTTSLTPTQGDTTNLLSGFYCGELQIGGLQESTFLNYQNATNPYIGGGSPPSSPLTFGLAVPFADTGGTISLPNLGYVYCKITSDPAGRHWGPNGINKASQWINSQVGPNGLGSSISGAVIEQSFFRPPGLKEMHADGVAIDGTTTVFGPVCATSPGQICVSTIDQLNGLNGSGWYGGTATISFAGSAARLNLSPTVWSFNAPTYNGPSGSVGKFTPTNTTAGTGTGYQVGDQFLINQGGNSTAVGIVSAIFNNGTSSGPVTAATILQNSGGTLYTVASGLTTTALTGSGSGLTGTIQLSTSAPIQMNTAGLTVNGGSLAVYGAGIVSTSANTVGSLNSFTAGGLLSGSGGVQIVAAGSGYTTGDVATLVESGASGGTVTITASNQSMTVLAVTNHSGTGYTSASNLSVTGGSCVGVLVNVGTVYQPGGNLYSGTGGVTIASGGASCTVGDVLTIVQPGASGGTVTVSTTANGVVTGITSPGNGIGYTAQTIGQAAYATTGGTGTGLTIKVTQIAPSAGELNLGSVAHKIKDTGALVDWTSSGPGTFHNSWIATSLTATGLTAGQCVQTGTGGLLTTTGSACGAGGGAVSSVFTRTGAVVAVSGDYTVGQVTGAAPLASPALTGVPTAPNATVGTNSTQLATTAFVLANGTQSGSLSTNLIPKASGAAALVNSSITDNGTNVSTTEPFTAPSLSTNGSANGALNLTSTGTGASAPAASTVQITVPNSVTAYAWTLPATQNANAGYVLSSDTAGHLSWVANGSGAPPAFSSVTGGTNAATLVMGTGGSLATSGTGTIAATSAPTSGLTGTLQAAQFPALTGDVTTSAGSLAASVVQVNGAVVPTTAACLASNSSKQLIACTATGTGSTVAFSAGPTFSGTSTFAATTATSTVTSTSTLTTALNVNSNGGGITIANSTAATSSTCANPGLFSLNGKYWTGAASATNSMTFTSTCTTGTNGAETLTLADSGSTGAFTFAVTGNGTYSGTLGVTGIATFTAAPVLPSTYTTGGNTITQPSAAGTLALAANVTPRHQDYWNLQGALFATSTALSSIYFEDAGGTIKALVARLSGTISCTVAPTIAILDLGTSPTTVYGSATVLTSLATGTSDGAFTSTGLSVAITAGHYVGMGYSAGTCVTAPTFDITLDVQ